MATDGVGSVGVSFSSSSLSLPASTDTFSAVQHFRAPQLVARSPSLLKANRGISEAAAIRGAVPLRAFTLRGKRQAREQPVRHEGGGCGKATTASCSPRRPRTPYRVEIGQGYSPRLRMMGREEFMHGSTTTMKVAATKPSSPTSRPGAASTSAKNAACDVAAAIACNSMASRQRASPIPCRDISTVSERVLIHSAAETITETTANPARGSQRRTAKSQRSTCIREHPMMTSGTECLCGRLWIGTNASPQQSEAVRPRVLFLVSGQQQQLTDARMLPCSETRRHQHKLRGDPVVIPLPPATKSAVPRGRMDTTTTTANWRWKLASGAKRDKSTGREGEARDDVPSPGSSCGVEDDEERYDARTMAATDGKALDSAKRVLTCHVRVPHPPPTSLLVLRLPRPATS